MTIQWKPVVGFEAFYEVSNKGDIRSFGRIIKQKNGIDRPVKGKMLKQTPLKTGYLQVTLYGEYGLKRKCEVHRFVAEAFLPAIEGKTHVNHINENKADNRVENLEWCTHQENSLHSSHTRYGSKHGQAKLNEKQATEIKVGLANGVPCKELAKQYEVSLQTIYNIRNGKIWRHI